MKIAVSGSSGMVGAALVPALDQSGHHVVRLVRANPSDGEIRWNPSDGTVDSAALDGVEAVVHLAGENIAEKRWNETQKKRIRDSRVDGTRLIATTLAGMQQKPQVLVCASAIGFYGDRGSVQLDENSEAGTGFLAEVCQGWEAACQPARDAGIRVVNLRIGVILSTKGGALAKMLTPFKLGVGGRVGSGQQYWSWVSLDDVVGSILHVLNNVAISGPVNAVAPDVVTNAEFTQVLGRVLGRPTIMPLPAFAARLALGEMADELLLASTRVKPTRLQQSDYHFKHSDLESALRHLLR